MPRASAGPAGTQRETLEADHRVAAPVGEPVIAGNHAARFPAGRSRPRRLGRAGGGFDHELIGSENELGAPWRSN